MTTDVSTVVVDLRSHRAWRDAQRRSRAMEEAMRRHPSFQSRIEAPRLQK
jgi:hypothetical protein